MRIDDIRVGDRVRKDMGDINALADSIKTHGLIHPPAVTSDGRLIAGHRRIQACIHLGMTDIPVRVIDVANLFAAERDENEVRKAFTPSEAVAIARVIEDQIKAGSAARRSAGAKARWAKQRGEEVKIGETPNSIQPAFVTAAAAVGMADQRYRQAKEVVEAAEQDAAQFGDIAETMDTTGNVMSAHRELQRRRDKAPVRHAVLRKMHHRDPNREVERAITSLEGLAMGVERIDIAGLDAARTAQWAADIKQSTKTLNRFARSIA